MKYTVIPAHELSGELVEKWSQLQQADGTLDSPYFRPEFTQAVAEVRDDVEVAILEEDNEAVGFFPFQRDRLNMGRPVGGRLSDFQGLIAAPQVDVDAADLLRGCRLGAWHFDHLLAGQACFAPYHGVTSGSPYIDVSQGYRAYRSFKNAHSDQLQQTERKTRKIQREVGALRFEMHTPDEVVFRTLLRWKSQQYHMSRLTDVFAYPWTVALLERIAIRQSEALTGLISALWVGDRLLAVHFGMRSFGVLHCWFPAYEREYLKYSPGLMLFLHIAEAAAQSGIRRIDLGKGDEQYKASLKSGDTPLAEGCVDLRFVRRFLRHGWLRTRDFVRSTPLRGPARIPARWIRSLRESLEFR